MIRRFFSLLLVLLMLANQGLCLAHSHRAAGVAESEDHASRPHFHFGGHSHETHHADRSHGHDSDRDPTPDDRKGDRKPIICPATDHDADAVYCSEAVTLAQVERTVVATNFAAVTILQVTHQGNGGLLRHGPSRGQRASAFNAACPIYLSTLSLRL